MPATARQHRVCLSHQSDVDCHCSSCAAVRQESHDRACEACGHEHTAGRDCWGRLVERV